MKPESWRLFVAVPVADEVKAAIAELLKRTGITSEFKCPSPEQIHLTLRFFGNVPADAVPELQGRLATICRRIAPFHLRAQGVGHFGERVLWIGLQGDIPSLHQLAAETAAQTAGFGEHRENRAFAPHLTIGRRGQSRTKAGALAGFLADHRSTSFGDWRVGHVELIRSVPTPSGAQYSRLATVPLAAAVGP